MWWFFGGYIAFALFLIYCEKWISAGLSILCGDKDALRDCNLCEKNPYANWTYKDWKDLPR